MLEYIADTIITTQRKIQSCRGKSTTSGVPSRMKLVIASQWVNACKTDGFQKIKTLETSII